LSAEAASNPMVSSGGDGGYGAGGYGGTVGNPVHAPHHSAPEMQGVAHAGYAVPPPSQGAHAPQSPYADAILSPEGHAAGGVAGRDGRTLGEAEIDLIRAAVDAAQGNISVASKRLGISRNTIYRKLRWAQRP
jgi:sigma-54 dependent transcriptional regulator, acetoin dehydrogenase operon transcriptional activator AcoR